MVPNERGQVVGDSTPWSYELMLQLTVPELQQSQPLACGMQCLQPPLADVSFGVVT
jgi:hypothetical protein